MQFYLAALRTQPQATEFWWVYATLFSTMIPSVVNLFLAGFSFFRSIRWSREFLLSSMRPGETMPIARRVASALILSTQGVLALAAALAAQYALAAIVLVHVLPALGLHILDVAAAVAM
jgi:hypothetical protein